MHIPTYLALILLLCAGPVHGEQFDRPVTTIQTDEEGVYHAGFMYWYTTQTPFLQPAEFAVVGEVINVTANQGIPDIGEDIIRIRVDEILVCPEPLVEAASRIRFLEIWKTAFVTPGDTVLVFMTRYEGAYAIPNWRGTNTSLGHKLHQSEERWPCDDRRFIELVRSGRAWDLDSLSAGDLRLWRCVDSEGLLEAFIRVREMSEEHMNSHQ